MSSAATSAANSQSIVIQMAAATPAQADEKKLHVIYDNTKEKEEDKDELISIPASMPADQKELLMQFLKLATAQQSKTQAPASKAVKESSIGMPTPADACVDTIIAQLGGKQPDKNQWARIIWSIMKDAEVQYQKGKIESGNAKKLYVKLVLQRLCEKLALPVEETTRSILAAPAVKLAIDSLVLISDPEVVDGMVDLMVEVWNGAEILAKEVKKSGCCGC